MNKPIYTFKSNVPFYSMIEVIDEKKEELQRVCLIMYQNEDETPSEAVCLQMKDNSEVLYWDMGIHLRDSAAEKKFASLIKFLMHEMYDITTLDGIVRKRDRLLDDSSNIEEFYWAHIIRNTLSAHTEEICGTFYNDDIFRFVDEKVLEDARDSSDLTCQQRLF